MNDAFSKQQDFVVRARAEGYTHSEIQAWISEKSELARAAGYSDDEIKTYLGHREFNPARIVSTGNRALQQQPKPVANLKDALEAGWGIGTASLAAQALTDGVMPDKVVTEDTPWYLRTASFAAMTVNDYPAMVAGSRLGGFPGVFALPAALRAVFIDVTEA